jgi:hypothetical protein
MVLTYFQNMANLDFIFLGAKNGFFGGNKQNLCHFLRLRA